MYIKKINIASFGKIRDFSCDFSEGVNIIEGKNESGKSTLLSFIKFVLYGAETRPRDSFSIPEKKLFIPWDGSNARGSIRVSVGSGDSFTDYIISRELTLSERVSELGGEIKPSYRENFEVVNALTGAPVAIDTTPGEYFLGVTEEIFRSTALVGQVSGAYVNGESVCSAIENLLFSADESVDTDRAIERLEAARRRLWHKSKKGGEIYELECRRNELLGRFSDSKQYSGDAISLEESAANCRAELAKNTARTEELKRLTALSEALSLKKRFDILHAHEDKIREIDADLGEMQGGDADDEAKLATLRARMEDAALAKTASIQAKAAVESTNRGEISTEYDEYLDEIADMGGREEAEFVFDNHVKGRKSCIAAGIILLIIALTVAAAAALTYLEYLSVPFMYWKYIALGAIIPFVAAILSFIRAGGHRKYVKTNLAAVGATSPNDYSLGLENIFEIERIRENQREEQYNARRAYENAKSRETDTASALAAAISAFGVSTAAEAIASAEAKIAERRVLAATKNQQEAALRVSGEQLSQYSEEEVDRILSGADLSVLDGTNINSLKREREFLISAAAALTEKLTDAEKKLAAITAVRVSPAEVSSELEQVEAQIKALTLRHDAYSLAVETLASASDRLRSGVSPRVSANACRILSSMTDGKYENLGVGENFSLSCEAGGMRRELDYLSSGTRDLTYVSLRLALVKELYRNETPPVFFDETFARVDDGRLRLVMKTLAGLGKEGGQSFVFTCQDRESAASEGLFVNKITL